MKNFKKIIIYCLFVFLFFIIYKRCTSIEEKPQFLKEILNLKYDKDTIFERCIYLKGYDSLIIYTTIPSVGKIINDHYMLELFYIEKFNKILPYYFDYCMLFIYIKNEEPIFKIVSNEGKNYWFSIGDKENYKIINNEIKKIKYTPKIIDDKKIIIVEIL